MLLSRSETGDQQRVARRKLVFLRHKRGWRSIQRRDQRAGIGRQGGHEVASHAKSFGTPLETVEKQRQVHERTDFVKIKFELGYDTKVATATAQRPEQVWMQDHPWGMPYSCR